MRVLVIYDITPDDVRLRVASICKDFGLVRIQKSAFLGALNSERRKEMKVRFEKVMRDVKGNIQIFQIPDPYAELREIVGEVEIYGEEELVF
ncbi:MAG: CRISPR-associated endonuclease Cas2 [Candidatus Korarchaeum sp.]|nr:CRISPR-associated endonuclease Cas2 [Candidatus Korarchaeum sp.]MDW8035686.1 CRISPR-associated endonuclease Cas2 [Candidatus Korarchaeum sp.]